MGIRSPLVWVLYVMPEWAPAGEKMKELSRDAHASIIVTPVTILGVLEAQPCSLHKETWNPRSEIGGDY